MFVNVAEVDKLARGTAKLIHVEGLSIALFNADGAFYALEDSCPFDGASLSHGWVTGSVVECRGDRARFFSPDRRVSPAFEREKYQKLQSIGR